MWALESIRDGVSAHPGRMRNEPERFRVHRISIPDLVDPCPELNVDSSAGLGEDVGESLGDFVPV